MVDAVDEQEMFWQADIMKKKASCAQVEEKRRPGWCEAGVFWLGEVDVQPS